MLNNKNKLFIITIVNLLQNAEADLTNYSSKYLEHIITKINKLLD